MSTPQTGAPEWDSAQASPWLPANKARRTFDAFALRTSVIDRDLTAPPATCSDGARYLVAATATGDWAGHDGQLAIAFGTNASNGWVFATAANEGVQIWVEDEETQIEYVNGQWVLSPDQIRFFGDLADVDLTGLNDGDQIYYDASNAQWYPAPPLSGSQPAGGTTGQVLTKQSDTSGDVFWDSPTLSGQSDVDVSALADGDQLIWDESNQKWYPAAPAAGGGGGGAAFRGALVKKSADQTGANYTIITALAWDAETYDTSSIHDNATNNSRLTVPSGSSYVRISGQLSISAITANEKVWTQITKNGSLTWDGSGGITAQYNDNTYNIQVNSAPVAVTTGDYFQLWLTIGSDTSVTINSAYSWFAMEIIE